MKKRYLLLAPPLIILAGLTYLNQFPSSVARAIPYVVDAALKDKPYQLEFSKAEVSRVGFDGVVSVALNEVVLLDDGNAPLARIPQALIDANIVTALMGGQAVERVTLDSPKVKLLHKADGSLRLSSGADETQLSSPAVAPVDDVVKEQSSTALEEVKSLAEGEAASALDDAPVSAPEAQKDMPIQMDAPLNEVIKRALAYLPNAVTVRGAQVTLIDEAVQTHVRWNDVSMTLSQQEDAWKGAGRAALQLPSGQALLTMNLDVDPSGNADMGVEFNDVNLASLCAAQRKICGDLADLSLPLSGEIHLLAGDAPLPNVAVSLAHKEVLLAHPDWFPEGGALAHYALDAEYSANQEYAILRQLKLGLGEGELIAKGTLSNLAGLADVDVQMAGSAIPLASLSGAWPVGVAEDARAWVTQNMPVGEIETLNAALKASEQQLRSGDIPKEAVFAEAKISGAQVHYLPGYPHVEQVSGTALLNAKSMNVLLTGGKTLSDSHVEEGEVRIADFAAPGAPMEIDLLIDAAAKDVASFINPPRYRFAKSLTLKPEEIGGRATGKIALKFKTIPIKPKPQLGENAGEALEEKKVSQEGSVKPEKKEIGEVFYDIQAELHQMSQTNVKGRWDFDKVDASVQADASGASIKGVGGINGVPSRFSAEDRIGKPTRYSFKGKVPKAKFAAFELPDHEAVSGWAEVDADVTLISKARQISKVTLGLTDAKIDIPALGWVKPEGAAASLSFKADTRGEETTLKDLALSSDIFALSGEVVMAQGLQFQRATLSTLRTGTHTASMNMSHLNGVYDIRLRGQGVDLSAFEQDAPNVEQNSEGFSISALPPLKIDADIASLILAKDTELKKVNAQVNCAGANGRCERANLSALLPKGDGLVARIYRNEKNQRAFNLASDDGAGLVKLLGIHDDIEGGKLNIRGIYHDEEKGAPLKGRLTMDKFTLRNAPILSKLLSLGSFTGMLDTLQGKGLNFDKLGASFTFANDLLTIEKSQLKGNTLGATQSGNIDLKQNTLDLKGALFPSYFLNTLISNVPVIGELITGGEGEGLVGVRYSVKGNASAPKTSVNPLSALTPGFTRGIFDAFEGGSDKEKAPAKSDEKDANAGSAAPKNILRRPDEAAAKLAPLPSQEVEIIPAK